MKDPIAIISHWLYQNIFNILKDKTLTLLIFKTDSK